MLVQLENYLIVVMEFLQLYLIVFTRIFHSSNGNVQRQHEPNAVTRFDELSDLYREMRMKEPHTEPDMNTNVETRKKICQSITSSGYFEMNGRKPLPMDSVGVLHELKSEAKYEEKQPNPIMYFRRVMEDFERKEFGRLDYSYRSRLTTFRVDSVQVEEFAFACLVRHEPSNGFAIYYISDPYRLNGDSQVRFLCLAVYSCELEAIAEEPALSFASPKYSIEDIYLRMRTFYNVAKSASQDPICGLTKSEKLRICASVLNSIHFVGKIRFFPNVKDFKEECKLNKVSFRKVRAKEDDVSEYYEWMLPCPAEPILASASFTYHVSRAYHSYHAVVYSPDYETDQWYIENISGRISHIIEKSMAIRVKYREHLPPRLTDLLQESWSTIEEV